MSAGKFLSMVREVWYLNWLILPYGELLNLLFTNCIKNVDIQIGYKKVSRKFRV